MASSEHDPFLTESNLAGSICLDLSSWTIDAGVVKLADAPDSKSGGAQTPCRFDSDLRHIALDLRMGRPSES